MVCERNYFFGKTPQQWKTPDKGPSLSNPCTIQPHPSFPIPKGKCPEVWLWECDIVLVIISLSVRLIIKTLWVVGWKWFWRKCFHALQMLNILTKTHCVELKIHSSGSFPPAVLQWVLIHLGGTTQGGSGFKSLPTTAKSQFNGKKSKLFKAGSAQRTMIFMGIRGDGWESGQLSSAEWNMCNNQWIRFLKICFGQKMVQNCAFGLIYYTCHLGEW